MIRVVLMFAIQVLVFSCSQTSIQSKLIDERIFGFAKEVRKTDHLELYMFGGGGLGKINSFTIGFVSQENVDVDRARYIFIDIQNRFLNFINQDQRLIEYSPVYPFTKDQVEVEIHFRSKSISDSPYIAGVSMGAVDSCKHDSIYYIQRDPLTGKSEVIYVEDYDQALNILNLQQCN